MKALSLSTALVAALLAIPSIASAQTVQPHQDGLGIIKAGMRISVGTCTTNLFQREGFSGGQKVKVTPLYDRDPYLALACANRIGSGTRVPTEADGQ